MNRCIAALLFCLVLRTPALAHLLPTQRATLNFIGSDVFTVIALPVEVFPELDDNGDQRVSLSEFNAHRESLSEFIRATVSLECSDNSYGLLDLMLSPDVGHTTDTDRPTARHGGGDPGIDQLTVLGRFALADVPADTADTAHRTACRHASGPAAPGHRTAASGRLATRDQSDLRQYPCGAGSAALAIVGARPGRSESPDSVRQSRV